MTDNRIHQLRLAAGLTLDDLVKRLADSGVSITKQALSNYEKSKRIPKPTILMALAKALNVKAAYLISEPSIKIEWLSYRCKTALRAYEKEEIQAQAADRAERYMYLQNLLFPDTKPNLPERHAASFDDAEEASKALRKSWKLGNAPIDSVTRTIESNGGVVVEIHHDNVKFDGLSGFINGCFPLIAVNISVSDDRIRLNLAHELGHLGMKCTDLDAKTNEKMAFRFASSFLIPAEVMKYEIGKMRRTFGFQELGLLKQKYGISMQALLYRMRDLKIITEPTYRSACAEFNRNEWKKKEPVEFIGIEKPMRFKQMVFRALSEGVITSIKAEELFPGITKELKKEEGEINSRSMKPSDLIKLPYSERLRILSEMAKAAEKSYAEDKDLKEFEAFGEDDLHD